ncbi:MAG: DUF1853 family protein [Moraxellaceae bacterium]|nr:DUF1853 family protein [Moraxellaceae bacterium]
MDTTLPVWQTFNTQQVRDLAWVLASPPLLHPLHSRAASGQQVSWLSPAWCDAAYNVCVDWLRELDKHPTPLLQALVNRDARLGRYVENLLAFWLAWPDNPFYRLLHRGLAVRDGNRTIGELDFLVEDRCSGRLQHWEIAVKFYLGTCPGGAYRCWQGPALQDRLDLKVDRLLHHQLSLPFTLEGAALLHQLNLPHPDSVCLLKGRLFYPPDINTGAWSPIASNLDHLRGWWMTRDDFLARYINDFGVEWVHLPKDHWLTQVDSRINIGVAEQAAPFIERLMQSNDTRAIAVIGLDTQHNEITRGFITPSGWLKDTK